MNNIIERTWRQGGMVFPEDMRGTAFTAEDGAHTFIISGVDLNGDPINLSGTVAASLIRPDGTTTPMTGTISGGKASVTLSAECYGVGGRASLTIFLTSGGQKVAIFGARISIDRSSTAQASPGVAADVVDLVNRIDAAVATIPASYTALMAAIAPDYSSSSTYPKVGSFVWYSGTLYRSKVAIETAESWTADHWKKATLGDDLNDDITSLKSALNNASESLGNGYVDIFPYHNDWKNGYFNASGVLLANNNNISPTNSPFLVEAGKNYKIIPDGLTANIYEYTYNSGVYSRTKITTFTDTRIISYQNDTYITVHFGGWTHGTDLSKIISKIEKESELKEATDKIPSIEQNVTDLQIETLTEQNEVINLKHTLLGIIEKKNVVWANSDSNKTLLTFNAKANTTYLFFASLVNQVVSYVSFYVEKSDGTRIATLYAQGETKFAKGSFVLDADSDDCIIRCSPGIAEGTITISNISIKSETNIANYFNVTGLKSASITNKAVFAYGNVICSADAITMQTGGTGNNSIDLNISNCYSGECYFIRAQRTGGADEIILVRSFASDGTVINTISTNDSILMYIVPENAKRILIVLYACHATALPADTVVTLTDVLIKREDAYGLGYNGYYGEKISLNGPTEEYNRCSISIWKDFKKENDPEIVNYGLSYNQSMAIYGDYVFLLNSGGTGIVCRYSTKEILGPFSYEPAEFQHGNSAQFTNIFYNDNDEFPLLMVSRCGNAGRQENPEAIDECTLIRVIRNNNTFTTFAINSIAFETIVYGGNWVLDSVNNNLFFVSNDDGNFTQNVPMVYRRFKMPSKTDILSGEPIVLTNTDVLSKFELDGTNLIGQGNTFFNGRLFHAVQTGERHIATVWSIDVERGVIVSSIPLKSNNEPEGLAIADGKLYVSQKNAADTESVNPLTVWQIEF